MPNNPSSGAVLSARGVQAFFTGIPFNAYQVQILLTGLTGNGVNPWLLRLGPVSGLIVAGYNGSALSGATGVVSSSVIGAPIPVSVANTPLSGVLLCSLLDPASNIWSVSYVLGSAANGELLSGGSSVSLGSGAANRLERVALLPGGADVFTAGQVALQIMVPD